MVKANEVSRYTILHVGILYTSNPNATLESIAARLRTTAEMVSKMLYRGFVEGIFDDEMCNKIYHKIVFRYPYGQRQRAQRWQKALDLRDEKKYSETPKSDANKIAELEYQIQTFDDYAIDEEGAPTKAELERRLFNLKPKHC